MGAGAQSPKETWLRLLLIDGGFPPPQTQIPLYENGYAVAFLDLGWPAIKLAVEYDGDQHRTDRAQYGARAERFVVCHHPDAAARDAAVRQRLIEHLQGLIDDSDAWPKRKRDEFVGSLRTKPGLRRLVRRTKTGLLRIDSAAAQRESHYDGKWLLRTSDLTLTAEDLAAAYTQLIAVERGWRDCKTSLGLRPVYHHREDRIRAHVQLCWLALLLIRVAETRTGDTWRNLHHELDRMHLVTFATTDGRVAQRSATTGDQKTILAALDLPEPPKYLDFTPFEAPAAD